MQIKGTFGKRFSFAQSEYFVIQNANVKTC